MLIFGGNSRGRGKVAQNATGKPLRSLSEFLKKVKPVVSESRMLLGKRVD